MNPTIEVLATYASSPLTFPIYLIEYWSDLWAYYSVWAVVAVAVLVLIRKTDRIKYSKPFIVLWIMPGTIICGSWASVPWPFALISYSPAGGCSTLQSLTICLLLNIVVVYGVALLLKRINRGAQAA